MRSFRIGTGYDIHRFSNDPNRGLVLGGVTIPDSPGLDGHSDADCLSHAIADAILGAVALPDIGHFFPNNDPSIAGLDSQKIIVRAVEEARNLGYEVGNVDAMIIAERPKLAAHIPEMRQILAGSLAVEDHCVGIKATTNEGIGSLGKGDGIAAYASALLCRI